MKTGIAAAGETKTGEAKAARLRRLRRGHDSRLQASGFARACPGLGDGAPEAPRLPPRGLTARELIAMARAARRADPAAQAAAHPVTEPARPAKPAADR